MYIKHIFLTGANGFIGSHILRRLLHDGYRVTVLLRENANTDRISDCIDHSHFQRIDITNMANIFSSDTPDIVLHLATCYRKYHTATDISEMIATNIDFPTQVCQLCVTHGVKYFINTGSFFEYDFSDIPLTEHSREKPFNLYASTKQAFNSIIKYYTEQYDFRSLTIRLFSPYGPDDNEKLIPVAIRSMNHGTTMQLPNGTQRLNFTYIDDIVDAYMSAIDKITSFSKKYDIVNIAPSQTYTLLEVLELLQEVVQKKLQLQIGPGDESKIWHSSFNSTYATELLGWHAKTPLKDGLLLTYNAYKNAI